MGSAIAARLRLLGALALALVVLGGCNGDGYPKHLKPISTELRLRMEAKGLRKEDPILVRIFKEEEELEILKYSRSEDRFVHLKTWEICAYSGELGPKFKEGDRQSPEGFYAITPGLMNPKSSYHLAFNMGFPNEFDRAHGRTGSHLMVHGDCSSRGCYAMTNEGIEEIYALAREAFDAGQRVFWVHAFPFRMTDENMERHEDSEHYAFWQTLKPGYDFVEETGQLPAVRICERRYVVNPIFEDARYHHEKVDLYASGPCPAYSQPAPEQYLAMLPVKQQLAEKLGPPYSPRRDATALAENREAQEATGAGDASAPAAQADETPGPAAVREDGAISSRWSF